MRNGLRLSVTAVSLFLTALPMVARADDWAQYRHDERRTGASEDSPKLPLTEVWSAPGGGCAVWHDRVFFRTGGPRPALCCADARTGFVRWSQPVPAGPAPVVTASGGVCLYDWERGPSSGAAIASGGLGINTLPPRRMYLRAFQAADGRPTAVVPWTGVPAAPRVILQDGPAGGGAVAAPAQTPVRLGEPLVSGDELISLDILDTMLRWTPGRAPEMLRVAHWRGQQERPDVPVQFGSYPGAVTTGGIFFAADAKYGPETGMSDCIIGALGGGGAPWHTEIGFVPGPPAVGQGWVFLHMMGRAGDGIVAYHPASGIPQWTFAPRGLVPQTTTITRTGPGGAGGTATVPHAEGWLNHELVVTNGRVYGLVNGLLTCVEETTGRPVWQQPSGGWPTSMVASKEHLFIVNGELERPKTPARILAFRLSDGKLVWDQPVPAAGTLSIGSNLLFLSDGATVRAFAPAERTYRMAVDTPDRGDYAAEISQAPGGDVAAERQPADAPADAKPAAPVSPRVVGDATALRLLWTQPAEELLRRVQERRDAAGAVPMLLALEWLDPTRSSVVGVGAGGWTPQRAGEFVEVCRQLARAAQPRYFEIGADLNVYLARHPEQGDAVRALVRDARSAIRRASPGTKVLVSFSSEALSGTYGRGDWPFGPAPRAPGTVLDACAALVKEVDAVGFTTYPQSGYASPQAVPSDYLLSLRSVAGDKPVLLTQIGVRDVAKQPLAQAAYLKRLEQLAYWLDAELLVYPGIGRITDPSYASDLALRGATGSRPALEVWRDALRWKRVDRLSLGALGDGGR